MTALSAGHGRLLAGSARWFDRARASVLGNLPCRQGCSRCCVGLFAITILDGAALQQGLAGLAPSVRLAVESQARTQVAAIEAVYPRLKVGTSLDRWHDQELEGLVERFRDLPCPALAEDGRCRVYPFRPVTCRMMGIPVEADGLVVGACDVQTAVPIQRITPTLRQEEQRLAEQEATELEIVAQSTPDGGHEVLLPYGFLFDRAPAQ